jgi:hypothetical protein
MKKIISILLLFILTAPPVVQYIIHTDVQVYLSMEMEELKDKDSKAEKKSSKEYLPYLLSLSEVSSTASTAIENYKFYLAAEPHLEFQSPPPDFSC